MQEDIFKNLNDKMNPKDINLLNKIIQSQKNNNKVKVSLKEKNDLISKLLAVAAPTEAPKKDIKDMGEDEKKIYREELRKRLKNKLNEKKMYRGNSIPINSNGGFNRSSENEHKSIPNNILNHDIKTTLNEQLNILSETNKKSSIDFKSDDKINSSNKIIDEHLFTNNIEDCSKDLQNISKIKINNFNEINHKINETHKKNEITSKDNEDLNDYIK